MSVFKEKFEDFLNKSETNAKLTAKVSDLEKRLIDSEFRVQVLMDTISKLMESCTKLSQACTLNRMAVEEIYTNIVGEECTHDDDESHDHDMSPEELEEFLKSLN